MNKLELKVKMANQCFLNFQNGFMVHILTKSGSITNARYIICFFSSILRTMEKCSSSEKLLQTALGFTGMHETLLFFFLCTAHFNFLKLVSLIGICTVHEFFATASFQLSL